MSAPVADRRTLLRGIGLAAAAGIVGTAGAAIAASPDKDAELIRVCAEIEELQRASGGIFNCYKPSDFTDEEWEDLQVRQTRFYERMESLVAKAYETPAITLAGIAALARAAFAIEPTLSEEVEPTGGVDLVITALRSLLAMEGRS